MANVIWKTANTISGIDPLIDSVVTVRNMNLSSPPTIPETLSPKARL